MHAKRKIPSDAALFLVVALSSLFLSNSYPTITDVGRSSNKVSVSV